MADKYQRLRDALAAGPTKEWSAGVIHPQPNVRRRTPDGGWGSGPYCAKTDQAYRDSAYIAAADPETIAALLAERDLWVAMGQEWLDKTEWVQTSDIAPRWLGRHRADVLREQIEKLTAERDALREALAVAREYVADEIAYLRNAFRGHEELGRVPEAEADLARIDAALGDTNAHP